MKTKARSKGRFFKWAKEQGGGAALARALGIEEHRAHSWLRGNTCPKPIHMIMIVELSGGAVSYEDIITDTMGKRKYK